MYINIPKPKSPKELCLYEVELEMPIMHNEIDSLLNLTRRICSATDDFNSKLKDLSINEAMNTYSEQLIQKRVISDYDIDKELDNLICQCELSNSKLSSILSKVVENLDSLSNRILGQSGSSPEDILQILSNKVKENSETERNNIRLIGIPPETDSS